MEEQRAAASRCNEERSSFESKLHQVEASLEQASHQLACWALCESTLRVVNPGIVCGGVKYPLSGC